MSAGTGHTRHRVPREADREAWLAQREPYVGASEVAALFGEHPFLTSGELALGKLGQLERTPENAAMRRGVALEDAVAQWWSAEHGIEVVEADDLYVVDGVVMATLDRLIVGTRDALEVKTTARYVTKVERSWWWQAQAQAVAADLDYVRFAVLDSSMTLQSFNVERDHVAGQRLIDAARDFLGHVREGHAPPFAEYPYSLAMARYPEVVDGAVELPDNLRDIVRALRAVQHRVSALTTEQDRLKGMLGVALGQATAGTVDGIEVCTWRVVNRNDLDIKALRADHPDIAEQYGRHSTSRRLLLK